MERILIGFIALVLLLMAVLPLFGFNLILVLGPAALEPFDPSVEPIYLFVGRSAGLATAAFFAVNFLRHRRPLTAAAPQVHLARALPVQQEGIRWLSFRRYLTRSPGPFPPH